MGVVGRLCRSIVFGLCVGVPAGSASAQDMPAMPKPGPEHQLLKEDEGTWDAKVEVFPGPGAAPMVSKGVEVNTIGCGGLCLITDFKGEMMPGQPFHGHGTATYDPQKKKYVGSWTDSMSHGLCRRPMSDLRPGHRTCHWCHGRPGRLGQDGSLANGRREYKGAIPLFTCTVPDPMARRPRRCESPTRAGPGAGQPTSAIL